MTTQNEIPKNNSNLSLKFDRGLLRIQVTAYTRGLSHDTALSTAVKGIG